MIKIFEIFREDTNGNQESKIIFDSHDLINNDQELITTCTKIWEDSLIDGSFENYGYFAIPIYNTTPITLSISILCSDNENYQWSVNFCTNNDSEYITYPFETGIASDESEARKYANEAFLRGIKLLQVNN